MISLKNHLSFLVNRERNPQRYNFSMMQLVAATPSSILSLVQYHSCSLCDTVAAPAMSTPDLEKTAMVGLVFVHV